MGSSVMSICTHTGLSRPECCCRDCLTDQIRLHQPALLEAEGGGEIRITRTTGPDRTAAAPSPGVIPRAGT